TGTSGEAGLNALIAQSAEPSGDHCENGGTRIDSGLDDDRDGVLDPEEIDDTTYVCSVAPTGGGGGCSSPLSLCVEESTLACVDIQSDPIHCGDCATTCPGHAGSATTCSDGVCGITCADGLGDCNASASDGCETIVLTDSHHCGSCGHDCGAGY